MSRSDPRQTAGGAVLLVGAGLGFALGGWRGMRGPTDLGLVRRLLSGAVFLFGAFAFLCGLLLLLSLLIPE